VIYEAVRGPFMPSFYGAYDDGELALIALEDLTDAEWPPPWSPSRIESVLVSLDALHRTAPPKEIEKLEAIRGEVVGWSDIAANPEPMLTTGLCAPAWLEEALPALLQAIEDAQLDGTELLHFDVRSDNLCLRGGDALFFDWEPCAYRERGLRRRILASESYPGRWPAAVGSTARCGAARSGSRRVLRRPHWPATSGHCSNRARLPARASAGRAGVDCPRARPSAAVSDPTCGRGGQRADLRSRLVRPGGLELPIRKVLLKDGQRLCPVALGEQAQGYEFGLLA
jgi:hypothetical protein